MEVTLEQHQIIIMNIPTCVRILKKKDYDMTLHTITSYVWLQY